MSKAVGYAAHDATAALEVFHFERRSLRPHDVQIKIIYCGVCHSDLHTARNEWHTTMYPVVPGHEIIGRIEAVGNAVKDFKVGDVVGVGCMVDSCGSCPSCKEHLEQYCDQQPVYTYNGIDKHDKTVTYGGYSDHIVVDDKFVLRMPAAFKEADYAGVAPLLCAGITTYSPLKYWRVKEGSRVGIVGLGGLGHVAIKLARAMGAHVVVFTTSPNKKADAEKLGAHEVVVSRDAEQMKKYAQSLDFILDTVAAPHDLNCFLELLNRDGTLCLLGVPGKPHPALGIENLIFKRRGLVGSLIGGIKETQEMLDFCAEHHITADIEMIPIQKINEAYERMLKSDVKYRFVIDMASLSA
jgi:uncharacterized zinc-type alcohol dehydrogenase-like protein